MHTRVRHEPGRTDGAPAAVQAARRAVHLNIRHGAFPGKCIRECGINPAERTARPQRRRPKGTPVQQGRELPACYRHVFYPAGPRLPRHCLRILCLAVPFAAAGRFDDAARPNACFRRRRFSASPRLGARQGAGNAASGLARRGTMHAPGKCGTIGTGRTAAGPARLRRINMHETECFYERV